VWQDANINSRVRIGEFRVTKEVTVECIEYLDELPSLLPIPSVPTAFVINLQDRKFAITDSKGNLRTVDALIKNKVALAISAAPLAHPL
jgi:hypothetical protein